MKKKQYTNLSFEIKEFDDKKKTIDGVFSTSDEDRHGDIVEQNWDLTKFKKNPVIINSHNYGDITEILGKAKVSVKTGQLEGKITFASDENPKADIAYKLYKGGFANAFSVGFIPKEFDDKGRILKSELLEISLVSVPANAMALAKSKGIKVEKLYGKNKKNVSDEGTPGGKNTGKSKNEDPGGAKKDNDAGIKKEVEVGETEKERMIKVLNLISENLKMVETRSKSVRAEKKILNKVIRNLINYKKTIC